MGPFLFSRMGKLMRAKSLLPCGARRFLTPVSAWVTLLLLAGGAFSPRVLAETVKVTGTGCALGGVALLADEFRKTHPDVKIILPPNIGSAGSIKAVLAGELDLGLSTRPLSENERAGGAREIPFARTAFVFAAHPLLNRSDISPSEATDIYAGRMVFWEDGTPIRLVLRPPSDSDTSLLRNMSPGMSAALDQAHARQGMLVAMTDQDCADAIEKTEGMFGTTTVGLATSEKRKVKVLSLSGVKPTDKAVRDGTYPYFKTISFVTGPLSSPMSAKFIEFAKSGPGRAILSGAGYVPVE